jgi:hypothetical protein
MLCIPLLTFEYLNQCLLNLDILIVAPELISTAYFINPPIGLFVCVSL